MATLTVSPNPAPPSTLVSVAGAGFQNAKTRLLLDGIGATTNVFRPRHDGTFNVGITVASTAKTQTLVAEQLSGSVWTERARTSVVVQVAAPTPTPVPTPVPTPTPPPSTMWVGLDCGQWQGIWTDVKGAVNYVRLDTPSAGTAASYQGAGLGVVACIVGPYNVGGVSALTAGGGAAAWAANAVALYRANPNILAIEILNEPGGTWFWGNPGAYTQANAAAYNDLIRATRTAFNAEPTRPKLLASYDGGYYGGSLWGQWMWAADPTIGTYLDGITIHPYGGTASVSSSALGNRTSVTSAHTATGLPVYVTEVGWPTAVGQPPDSALQCTEADQATNVYNFVVWARSTGYVAAVFIFNWRDFGTNNWYGVTRLADASHKKSYEDLRRAGLGLPQS